MPKSTRKRRSKSKTGYFGVVKQLNGGKYQAYISIGKGKKKYIGSSYKTAKQAAQAHDKEAIKLRRPFSKLNFPEKTPDGYTPRQQALVSRNTVGYRGVSKRGKNYHAQTKIGGKTTGLGNYDTAKEAAIAYDRAVLKANKCTSLLNFPDMVHNLDVESKKSNNEQPLEDSEDSEEEDEEDEKDQVVLPNINHTYNHLKQWFNKVHLGDDVFNLLYNNGITCVEYLCDDMLNEKFLKKLKVKPFHIMIILRERDKIKIEDDGEGFWV